MQSKKKSERKNLQEHKIASADTKGDYKNQTLQQKAQRR